MIARISSCRSCDRAFWRGSFADAGSHAKVEAVFERSIYLRSGDMFVCVGEPAIGNGPLTLIADFGVSRPLTSLGLYPGQTASMSDRCIAIGDCGQVHLRPLRAVAPTAVASLPVARELNDLCGAIARRDSVRVSAGRSWADALSAAGRRGRDATGAHRTSAHCAVRSPGCSARSKTHGPITASPAPVADLVGLGPGLTPSGDDFLVGALALLDALSERKAHAALARAIAAMPRGLTSPLSECLLKTAAAGHVGARISSCAVSAVVSGAPDQAIAAIRKIGHGSGWDMMVGILTALLLS